MKLTLHVAKVVTVMARGGEHYGLGLIAATGVRAGNLYPILARMDKAGWIVFTREDRTPCVLGRPARRYFQLAPPGDELVVPALEILRTEAAALKAILS